MPGDDAVGGARGTRYLGAGVDLRRAMLSHPRRCVAVFLAAVAVALSPCEGAAQDQQAAGPTKGGRPGALPISGTAQPGMAEVEAVMTEFMVGNQIPGGVLAVARRGRLVYQRGFGYSDRSAKTGLHTPVVPGARFRIASISKPFTAVAVLQLVQAGKLKLDDKVYDLLQPKPLDGEAVHPSFKKVTVAHLLQHRGGWSRNASFDPMFRSHIIAAAVGRTGPAEPGDIIRYMVSRKTESEPGEYYSYSNFGYCLLGRVIEAVSEKSYGDYMRIHVLDPLGLDSMALGRSRESERLAGEVQYHGQDWRLARSVFSPDTGLTVRWPYGGFYLEAMDSHGAWVASARDLLKFACDFDDPKRSRLLSASSIETMFARPPGLAARSRDGELRSRYYACGWAVHAGRGLKTEDHSGSLPGTAAKLVRREDRVHWVVLFNSRRDRAGKRINADQIHGRLGRALTRVKDWPDVDEFQ